MFKKISLLFAASAVSLIVGAANTVNLAGYEFGVDTVFHATVGPGTTQTSLHLHRLDSPQLLRVFYLTVDMKNPVVTFETTIAGNKLSGGATIPNQAEAHNSAEQNFFAGINTDFFITSGTATNGVSKVGAPVHAAIAQGEIYKTTNGSSAWPNFFFDETGKPVIGAVNFSKGTAEANGKTVALNVINNGMAGNGVTLFTPKYYGVMEQPGAAGSCAEVTLKKIEGPITAGKTAKFEVTSAVSSTGNKEYSGEEYIIAGKGDGKTFVEGLKIGDVVTVTPRAFVGNKEVFPMHLCTGNPHILKDGVTLESEGDRGDASARHPRSSIGFNSDMTKFVMMVIDGRSAVSAGVHTMELADMMKYAGATDAVNVDGGGSSTLYTDALGVRNATSDGHARAVASGLFAVANAPQDETVAEIRFIEWAMQFPRYGIYTPKFYGYNKYGVLVDTDVKGVTLSCDSKIGEIINDGATFYGTGSGCGALVATLNGMTASIPVTVSESDKVKFRLENVLIDNVREYPIEVNSMVGENEMAISPSALAWVSDNSDIASVDANTGVLKGVKNGKATITGKVGSFTGNLNVTVEIPTADVMPVFQNFPTDAKIKQVGGTGIAMTEFEKGFKLNYIGNTGRGQYIEINKEYPIWSLPEKLKIRINPGDTKISKITATAKNAFGVIESVWTATASAVPNNQFSEFEFNLSDWCDPEDIAVYPITLEKLRFTTSGSVANKEYEIIVSNFEAIYNYKQGGIEENVVENGLKVYAANGEIVVNAEEETVVYVASVDGRYRTYKVNAGETRLTGFDHGIYIVNGKKVIL